jgi:hypothetical protein
MTLAAIKAAAPLGAAAYLGTRIAAGFVAGKSQGWQVAAGIAGALAGVVLVQKLV